MITFFRLGLFAVVTFAVSGCISNQASSLSSMSMEEASIPVNPALSLPEGGMHPYVAAGISSKHGYQTSKDSIEEATVVTLSTGCNWHESIEETRLALPFFGASVEGRVISYNPQFSNEERSSIKDEGIDIKKDLIDYSAELGVKGGVLLRSGWFMTLLYLQGVVKYEDGSYASLRQDVDGIRPMYNLVNSPWTYGYSYGFDIQGGSAGKWDVGFITSVNTVFNETQSVSWDYIEENVESPFSHGQDRYESTVILFGPYFDYRNFRLSAVIIDFSSMSAQISWRF